MKNHGKSTKVVSDQWCLSLEAELARSDYDDDDSRTVFKKALQSYDIVIKTLSQSLLYFKFPSSLSAGKTESE